VAPTAMRAGRRRGKGMDRRWELKGIEVVAAGTSSVVSEAMVVFDIVIVIADGTGVGVGCFGFRSPAKLGSLLECRRRSLELSATKH
jgi:hypothetical protein